MAEEYKTVKRLGGKSKFRKRIKKDEGESKASKAPAKKKTSSFGAAFAAARKAGKKEFTWNGKRYHTRTKEEDAKYRAAKANYGKTGKKVAAKAEKDKKERPKKITESRKNLQAATADLKRKTKAKKKVAEATKAMKEPKLAKGQPNTTLMKQKLKDKEKRDKQRERSIAARKTNQKRATNTEIAKR
jgi:hypothetical protein